VRRQHLDSTRDVFITGGTGYIGRRLIADLLARGHRVKALARSSSLARVPTGATPVEGNALESASFQPAISPASVFIQLVGTPNPNPAKAAEFVSVDLAAARAGVKAAQFAGVSHFIYVSVANPAPMMQAYIDARLAGEGAIQEAGLTATVMRPWYVLGPGHWWPIVLVPGYFIGELLPMTRESARRLGLVTLGQMVRALVHAVEHPPESGSIRIVDVPSIRRGSCD